MLLSDGQNGAIGAWSDLRNYTPQNINYDIFANRLFASAPVSVPTERSLTTSLSLASGNPTRGEVRLRLELLDAALLDAEVVDVSGRRVSSLCSHAAFAEGPHSLAWNGADERGYPAPPGLYFVRVQAGATALVARVVKLAGD